MLSLILAAALCQDELLPLGEGTVWTWDVREKAGSSETATEHVSVVKGARTLAGEDWIEVTNYFFYEKAFLRVSGDGLEFRAPEYGDHKLLLFKKGAKSGDSWTSTLTDVEKVRFTLAGEESVEVPAGRFTAWKVAFVITETERGATKKESEGEIWFAPGTGIVKGSIARHIDCCNGATKSFELKKAETK